MGTYAVSLEVVITYKNKTDDVAQANEFGKEYAEYIVNEFTKLTSVNFGGAKIIGPDGKILTETKSKEFDDKNKKTTRDLDITLHPSTLTIKHKSEDTEASVDIMNTVVDKTVNFIAISKYGFKKLKILYQKTTVLNEDPVVDFINKASLTDFITTLKTPFKPAGVILSTGTLSNEPNESSETILLFSSFGPPSLSLITEIEVQERLPIGIFKKYDESINNLKREINQIYPVKKENV